MCNSANCNHLDDQIDDIFGLDDPEVIAAPVDDTLAMAQQVKMHEEACPACKGTGSFRSYAGRIVGSCFKCKGKGRLYFRQSMEQRTKAKAQRDARKAKEQQSIAEQVAVWCSANPNEAAWLREASGRGFEFATSLLDALNKYGHLTEKQEAAVRNATEKSMVRKAQWEAERIERDANKADVDITRIATAFATAKASGLRFPKLHLDTFTFSLASASGRNAGSIYVKEDETYLGKIADGKLTRSRDCDADLEARIVAACADPSAAAEAYGKRTGRCSCCGRELTNEESVARSIGPICAGKWGL